MRRLIGLLPLIAVMFGLAAGSATAQTVVQDVGGERVVFAGAASPRAIVFVFAGGDGTVAVNGNGDVTRLGANFLLRTRPLWLAQGFAYMTMTGSSSLLGTRHTPAYAALIARAIDFARTRANAPVWLIGTSMGTIAAANGAAHLPGRVAGVVLSSSVAGSSRAGETVFDSDLGAISVPALVVANREDTCRIAAPGFAPQILAALTRAPKKELFYVDSSQIQSDPCEALSPHGYLGIESDVVQRIAAWIATTTPR